MATCTVVVCAVATSALPEVVDNGLWDRRASRDVAECVVRRPMGVPEMLSDPLRVKDHGSWALVEREGELADLESLLSDVRRACGRVSLIEGPTGIGKTSLLKEACRRASAVGVRVAAARGGELERDYGFGIVRQLFEPTLTGVQAVDRGRVLAGAARIAEAVFGAMPEQDPALRPTHALLHGLYWLTANLAETGPLLLAVDDVQWADEPSLRFLLHLARRLDGMRVGIALASRTGETGPVELLSALLMQALPPILRPKPLSGAAVGRVVRAVLGEEAGPTLIAACQEATGGNPFLVRELLEELGQGNRPVGQISPAAVAGLGPERIARAALLRAGSVGFPAPALVRAVSVLGVRADVNLAADLAGLDVAKTRATARALVKAAILDPGEPLCFTHPIVRTAVYEDMTAGERSQLHARAAGLLAAGSAGPESIAVHLLACDPADDAWRVAMLRDAARSALSRGAPEIATRYLRRALAEPAPHDVRPRLLLELGSAADRSGDVTGLDLMRRGFDMAVQARTRAEGGLELGLALLWGARRVDEGVVVLERALEGAENPALASRIEAVLLLCGVTKPSAHARLAHRLRETRSRIEQLPIQTRRLLMSPLSVDAATSTGTAASAAELSLRALTGGHLLQEEVEADLPLVYPPVWVLVHTGQLAAARHTLREATAKIRACGSPLGLAMVSAFDAFAHRRAGDLAAAEIAARTSLELATEANWGILNPIAAAVLATVHVERGELAQAWNLLALIEDTFDPTLTTSQDLREIRARLRAAERDATGALGELMAIADWEKEWGAANGIFPVPWRSAAALVRASTGEINVARELAHDELVRARRFGADRPVGTALRALGLLQPPKRGIEHLEAAAEAFARSEDRLEHARVLVDLGQALRRTGRVREARKRLAEGMDLAYRCTATTLVLTAHRELTLTGARPRRIPLRGLDALTASERRVAEMAAEGMTNKEIAQSLFVTLRTVEMHLSNAYTKLEIGSRGELQPALNPSYVRVSHEKGT